MVEDPASTSYEVSKNKLERHVSGIVWVFLIFLHCEGTDWMIY